MYTYSAHEKFFFQYKDTNIGLMGTLKPKHFQNFLLHCYK
jgi:hypothetical protein